MTRSFANETSESETQNNPHSECLGLIGNSEKFLKGCLLTQKLANVPISKAPIILTQYSGPGDIEKAYQKVIDASL